MRTGINAITAPLAAGAPAIAIAAAPQSGEEQSRNDGLA